jgi:hypothetical protein
MLLTTTTGTERSGKDWILLLPATTKTHSVANNTTQSQRRIFTSMPNTRNMTTAVMISTAMIQMRADTSQRRHQLQDPRTDSDGDIYVTAPETLNVESVSRSYKGKGKGKARATGVDGVLEEDSEGEAHAEAAAADGPQDDEPVFKDAKEVQSIPPETPLDDETTAPTSSDGGNKNGHIVEIVKPKAINADYDESPVL